MRPSTQPSALSTFRFGGWWLVVGLLLTTGSAYAVDRCYAIWNASALHTWWRVDCVPSGVTFIDTNGVIPPNTGKTIAFWTATQPGDEPPDVMAGITTVSFADQDDLDLFLACVSGPCILKLPECWWFDFDGDGDVDQNDYGEIQRCKNLH